MYNDIIDQTINAGLSRSEESMVLRLLHVADPKTGKVALLMDDFLHLCDLRSMGAATRYLCTLKRVGIISYHKDIYRMDAQIFVTFLGWGVEVEEGEAEDKIDELREEVQEIRRLLIENCASKSARGDVENGEQDAQISTKGRADSVQQTEQEVSLFVNTHSPESQEQTNQQTRETRAKGRADLNVDVQKDGTRMNAEGHGFEAVGARDLKEMTESSRKGASNFSPPERCSAPFLEDGVNTPPPSISTLTEEQYLSFRLLTAPEIGVGTQKARQIAKAHRFAYVRRHTFAWLAEMESGQVRGLGALVHRIEHHFGAGEPTTEQQQSELYQRHRTAFEVEAESQAKEEREAKAAQRRVAPSQPKSQPQPINPTLWPQVLAQLKTVFPSATYDYFLQPTQLLGVQDGVYVVGLPNSYLRDEADRYRGMMRRTLGALVGDDGVQIRLEISGIS